MMKISLECLDKLHVIRKLERDRLERDWQFLGSFLSFSVLCQGYRACGDDDSNVVDGGWW